jgi:hypothetical protein
MAIDIMSNVVDSFKKKVVLVKRRLLTRGALSTVEWIDGEHKAAR